MLQNFIFLSDSKLVLKIFRYGLHMTVMLCQLRYKHLNNHKKKKSYLYRWLVVIFKMIIFSGKGTCLFGVTN